MQTTQVIEKNASTKVEATKTPEKIETQTLDDRTFNTIVEDIEKLDAKVKVFSQVKGTAFKVEGKVFTFARRNKKSVCLTARLASGDKHQWVKNLTEAKKVIAKEVQTALNYTLKTQMEKQAKPEEKKTDEKAKTA